MREPDPSHSGGVDRAAQPRHEVLVVGVRPGVDHDRLLGMDDEGVDREEAQPRESRPCR